jgi:predicted nuclease of predicted toxin-antitoxin system
MPRLLLDENLSHRLLLHLGPTFLGSTHVRAARLTGSSDTEVWSYAAKEGFVLVTKDDDFRQLSFLRGAPPKVIWVVAGNAGTTAIAALLARHEAAIEAFSRGGEESLLVLRLPQR